MSFVWRALRFLLSWRGQRAIRMARRARAIGKEWYPVRVQGVSMIPTLRPGDFLAVRFPRAGEPRAGQIVVATGERVELVKRVAAPPRELAQDEFWLVGDNPNASTDSRGTGPVARMDIMGVVRARYWPPQRARLF